MNNKECIYTYGHWQTVIRQPENVFGFVYLIQNKISGRLYIGCKQMVCKNKKPNAWMFYTGSSKALNEDIMEIGKNNFTFAIIEWHTNKTQMKLAEAMNILKANALYSDMYYNEMIFLRLRNKKRKGGKTNEKQIDGKL